MPIKTSRELKINPWCPAAPSRGLSIPVLAFTTPAGDRLLINNEYIPLWFLYTFYLRIVLA